MVVKNRALIITVNLSLVSQAKNVIFLRPEPNGSSALSPGKHDSNILTRRILIYCQGKCIIILKCQSGSEKDTRPKWIIGAFTKIQISEHNSNLGTVEAVLKKTPGTKTTKPGTWKAWKRKKRNEGGGQRNKCLMLTSNHFDNEPNHQRLNKCRPILAQGLRRDF